MDLALRGKVVAITGGSEGIGRATALRFAAEGAKVAICARRPEVLNAFADELRKSGADVLAVVADAAKPGDAERFIEETVKRFGCIDAVINNAGGTGQSPFDTVDDKAWQSDIDIKVLAHIRDPALADTRVAHGLALAYLWQARELETGDALAPAELAWERAISHWALVLSDDAYWADWRQDRAARYQRQVTQGDVARLRSHVGQELLNRLNRAADGHAAAGDLERAERYRHLAVALEVELEGARALKEVGGLPLASHGGRNLVCGPLYLRHAGLGRLVGERVARLEAEAGDSGEQEDLFTALDAALGTGLGEPSASVSSDALYRLRCAFSTLGKPLLLLERHQPEQAILALPELYRARLSELPADCNRNPCAAGTPRSHLVSCAHCQRFLASDPGYLCLPHRSTRLFQDAVELATRASLAQAHTALTTRRDGYREALQHWRDAIEVSRNAGAHVRTKRAIVRVVLGRADALDEQRGPQRGERLSHAIELIEGARELIGGADEGQLVVKAAEVLTDRGVWYGNGGDDDEEPDFAKAAEDLRRALKLTPGALRALDNLSRALTLQAANLPPEAGSHRAFELFAEALRFLHDGLRHTAGHQPLRRILLEVLDQLDERVLYELSPDELARLLDESEDGAKGAAQLAARAAERMSHGDEAGALRTFIAAVRLDPGDEAVRRELLAAVELKARPRS